MDKFDKNNTALLIPGIVREFLHIGAHLQKTGDSIAGEFGLNQQHFLVLNKIVISGAINQKTLARELVLEKSNLSELIIVQI